MLKHAYELRRKVGIEADDTAFPAYAWPGGYPLFYYGYDRNEYGRNLFPVCVKCANAPSSEWPNERLLDAEINYEDSELYCEVCSERIQSADRKSVV